MTIEITCECGTGVPFDATNNETTPIRATCSGCGQTWELDVRKLRPYVHSSNTSMTARNDE